MITLKQAIFTMAAAAVSICASPLSTDSTATSIIGAPEAAVTETSKPLEGQELEDFLASEPHVPDGAIDITNTTLSAELVQFMHAHPEANPLTKRGGACGQGQCPDFFAAFDLYEQFYVTSTGGIPVTTWFYWGRWNDCGQCGQIATSSNGCFDFTSCGRKQSVCIDTGKFRAHRVWHDVGHKTCYNIKVDYLGGCGILAKNNIWHPTGETACNW